MRLRLIEHETDRACPACSHPLTFTPADPDCNVPEPLLTCGECCEGFSARDYIASLEPDEEAVMDEYERNRIPATPGA